MTMMKNNAAWGGHAKRPVKRAEELPGPSLADDSRSLWISVPIQSRSPTNPLVSSSHFTITHDTVTSRTHLSTGKRITRCTNIQLNAPSVSLFYGALHGDQVPGSAMRSPSMRREELTQVSLTPPSSSSSSSCSIGSLEQLQTQRQTEGTVREQRPVSTLSAWRL
ncbi:unnamed protein product [Pleuronectes platessa]|uniref:Uncharacterized protein n=1 Tax=Pleuronectes platessa TaxID=8262 RepID=A0A9N7YQY0_PLEPL|nr:unnamed protein product [Pleuronectes platessa]